MRYYLTGATGFIGGHVARQLVEAGHHVVALARSPSKAAALQSLGVELIPGDITDPDGLAEGMAGADGVFHIAGWYKLGARKRDMAFAINVDGTRNVLGAAVAAGVPRVVYTSTLAVHGDTGGVPVDESYRIDGPWLSLYDETKWRAHYEVAEPMIEAGAPVIIAQPGLVYGPEDHSNLALAFRDYLRGNLPMIPTQGGCWAHVEDTARGHVLAMEKGEIGRSYHLAGPCRMWSEILPMAEEITGVKAPRFALPPWAARMASWLMKPVNALVPLPPTYHPETLRVAAGATYYGRDDRAREELGWSTRPLREGLEETLKAEMAALGM
jgi:nucleoside-diphosphate-sugar epimerase